MTDPLPRPVATAVSRVNTELHRVPAKPMTLSAEAAAELAEAHALYLGDVGQEAVRIARRAGVRTVDAAHVQQARIALHAGRGTSVTSTLLLAFGGLFGGSALSSWYAIFFSPGPHGTAETVVALVLVVLSVVLLTIGSVLVAVRRR